MPAADAAPLLEVEGASRHFDGLVALSEVSLSVRAGQIKGLIGPNGAGKTTLFNLITGQLPPSGGDIRFAGRSVVGLPPHRIAARGIARTFQNVQVFPGMTVLENVLVGFHRHLRSGLLACALRSAGMRAEEAAAASSARALLEEVGLAPWADVPVERLPFGLLRAVEIARALAAGPRLLLLDEPGSGLAAAEKDRITALIRQVRQRGVTVLLVEHDMELLMGLADEIAVLDHGLLIADGPPAAIQQDARVIAAYLGEADEAVRVP